jgi:hypothetical protein
LAGGVAAAREKSPKESVQVTESISASNDLGVAAIEGSPKPTRENPKRKADARNFCSLIVISCSGRRSAATRIRGKLPVGLVSF